MVVEAKVQGAAVVLRHAEAPLADDRRRITGLLQELRDGDRAGLHGMLAFRARLALHVVANRGVAQMFAGHQRAAAGAQTEQPQ